VVGEKLGSFWESVSFERIGSFGQKLKTTVHIGSKLNVI
jgi:hypothetical protein